MANRNLAGSDDNGSATMRWQKIILLKNKKLMKMDFNPFLANVPILYPLKTPENQRFSGVFRGYKMGTLARNGLMQGKKNWTWKFQIFLTLTANSQQTITCV